MTRRIEVKVYEDDGSTLAGTLASDNKRSFLKDLSAEGAYGLQVKIGHADEALLTDGRIVRFLIDGTARWQGLVEPRKIVYADPSQREAGRVVNVEGRGTLALLERAVVYPELGLGVISPGVRYFNPASFDFSVSGWSAATAFHQQKTVTDTDPYYSSPRGWKDGDAYWIGPSDGVTSLPADIGFYWLVKEFTIAAGDGGDRRFEMTADDGFEFYLDGNKELAEARAGLWGVSRETTLTLDEGTHRIAVRVENFDRPVASTNATAFILSCEKVVAGGIGTGTVDVRTDNTWKIYKVTTVEPGMTPGKVLDILLDEAQTRGMLADLSWDFTATQDSNGTAWPTSPDLAFNVNSSYLEVVRHLVDEHLADVEMSATGLTLHAYVSKGADRGATPGTGLSTVSLLYASNLSRLAFSKTPPGPNVTLSQTAEGRWVEASRSASVTAWGRREVGLSLGSAPSADAADRQVEAFFDDHAEPIEAITDMQVEEVNAVPLEDFDVGDIVSATSSSGAAADVKVTGIRVSEDAGGVPVWAPDVVRV